MRRPARLSRLDQHFPGCSIYFITCCSHAGKPLLANDEMHQTFVHFCTAAQARQVWVGRYVIMPDHLHFFVDCGEAASLSTWIKSLKNALSKCLRGKGEAAPHWQKGFFDHVVRSEASYEAKWIYTRENPVRAGLAKAWEDWRYQGEVAQVPFD